MLFKNFTHAAVSLGYEALSEENSNRGRCYITPSGRRYPSITTVLGAGSKDAIAAWRAAVGEEEANRVSRYACTRGTAVHSLAELYLDNKLTTDILDAAMPHVRASFLSVKSILDQNVDTIFCQESQLYSDHLGVAGRVDTVASYDGVCSIIDFKTASRVKSADEISNYFAQATAYAIMFEERTGIPVPRIVIIMAVDNHPHGLCFVRKRDSYVSTLNEAISIYNKSALFGHV